MREEHITITSILISRNILSICISPQRSNSLWILIDIFVKSLSPSFIVNVQQRRMVLSINLQLNYAYTPNLLCIFNVQSVACFHLMNLQTLQPLLIIWISLLILQIFLFISFLLLLNHHNERIYHFWWIKLFRIDFFSANWTNLLFLLKLVVIFFTLFLKSHSSMHYSQKECPHSATLQPMI